MLVGSEIGAALTALEPLGIDMIGLNCATGPAEMSEHLRHLARQRPDRRSRACPTPGSRCCAAPARTTRSLPRSSPRRTTPSPGSTASASSAAAAAPRRSTCARWWSASVDATSHRGTRVATPVPRASTSTSRSVHLLKWRTRFLSVRHSQFLEVRHAAQSAQCRSHRLQVHGQGPQPGLADRRPVLRSRPRAGDEGRLRARMPSAVAEFAERWGWEHSATDWQEVVKRATSTWSTSRPRATRTPTSPSPPPRPASMCSAKSR